MYIPWGSGAMGLFEGNGEEGEKEEKSFVFSKVSLEEIHKDDVKN